MFRHIIKILFLLFFLVATVQAAEKARVEFQPAVASAHPLATEAGIEIDRKSVV